WSSSCPRTTTSCATGWRRAASLPATTPHSEVTSKERSTPAFSSRGPRPHRGELNGEIDPDVLMSVPRPPQMPATLEAGTIHGYCVGEPWNQQAVFRGIGVPVVTDFEIWKNTPQKIFGIAKAFAEANPKTTLAITKALIRAAMWLDENDNANRMKAVEILSKPEYVGADAKVIANSMN